MGIVKQERVIHMAAPVDKYDEITRFSQNRSN